MISMKKTISLFSIATFLFFVFASCNNSTEAKEPEKTETTGKKDADTSKTKVDVNSSGVSVQTKGGTQVSVGDKGGEVKTKDLDVNIKPGGK